MCFTLFGKNNIMNLFKKLFGGDQSPTKPSPREIVYDFADVLGQLNLPILDARLLPHPKAEIYTAFQFYMAQLEAMAKYSGDSREELKKVSTLYVMISDFQDIDPEDRQLVNEVNAGPRFAKFRTREGLASGFANKQEEEDFMLFSNLQNKYFLRATEEQGIN
jgi:hypothetical protein